MKVLLMMLFLFSTLSAAWSEVVQLGDNSTLNRLSDQVLGVITSMQMSPKLSPQRGEVGPLSKDELKSYSSYCQFDATKKDEHYKNICADVDNLSSAIGNKRESKEWEKVYKSHWVQYNPHPEKGYTMVRNRSNASLITASLARTMNNIVPIWMGDLQMKSQIDVLGIQALYQKQLNYM